MDALSDDGLVAYLTRCREHHSQMIYQHMRFTGSALLPVGDLLAHLGSWTGVAPASALAMMRGAAPVSAGASGELERLIAAIRQDPAARALLDSDGEPGKTLSDLRAFGGDVGTAMSEYLDLVGCRLLDGFDISGRYALELPDALLRAIRSSVDGVAGDTADVDALIAGIRVQVPDRHRVQFDELVGEARLMSRLRDERGVYSDIWASGIMRRAALAAGRRLQGKGRVHDAEHFIDAGFGEMCFWWLARAGRLPTSSPSASRTVPRAPPSRLRRRSGHRRRRRLTRRASRRVSPGSCTPWASRWPSCPAARRRRMRRTCCAAWPPVAVYTKGRPGASGPSEFGRIVQGDVLVTESTTEAFNILLPLLGAIVTDAGGLLSHSAIVAREYGIPGVVGTRNATDLIPDGSRVRVDGDAGEVTVYP